MLIQKRDNRLFFILSTVLLWGLLLEAVGSNTASNVSEETTDSVESTQKQTVPEWLIIDGTRNISYNMVRLLADQNIACTVLVRPEDLSFAAMQLPQNKCIDIVSFDFTAPIKNPSLCTAGAGAKYLFLDPECDTYKEWHKVVPVITKNALTIAKNNNLTLFYPARVYVFNNEEIITEESPYTPTSSQGLTLMKIESMLKRAADNKICKIRKIRMSYAFGPAVFDYLLSSSFKDIPTLGRLTWLFRIDKPHQFCYAPDVARIALQLSTYRPEVYDFTVHFSGYTYDSVEEFGNAICKVARTTLKPRVVSKFQLSLVCFFEPNAERGSDLGNYFEQPVYMEDSAYLVQEIAFQPTPPELAFKTTLEWFERNQKATRSHHRRFHV